MADDTKPPIVIKRIKKGGHGHHGGAWKIAYADFVTAMMAFFLLMWLLGSTTKADLNGISEYFKTPLKVALAGGSGSGDSSSVIKGGGQDLTRSVGQKKEGELPSEKKIINLKATNAEVERTEAKRLAELKNRLNQAFDSNGALKPFRDQIRVEMTPDGLRILVIDEQNRPMFGTGSAVLNAYMREILREIARSLNDVPNRLSLSGHTDSTAYAEGDRGYSNWELSADRANTSRRELVAGGLEDQKIIRIVGMGSAVPMDGVHPADPTNRRISITVLNQRAERRILDDYNEAPRTDPTGTGDPPADPAADPAAEPAAEARTAAAPAPAGAASNAAAPATVPAAAPGKH